MLVVCADFLTVVSELMKIATCCYWSLGEREMWFEPRCSWEGGATPGQAPYQERYYVCDGGGFYRNTGHVH